MAKCGKSGEESEEGGWVVAVCTNAEVLDMLQIFDG